jgi:predicted dehydrogenase
MRALIVGLGAIGRRHLRNLKQIEPGASVAIWHQHSRSSSDSSASSLSSCTVFQLEDALATRPEFALITGPASVHVQTGLDLADRGIHLLIEKPLSNGPEGVDLLLERCRERQVALMVGYNFRFYEPLQEMRQALQAGRIGRVLSIRAEVGQYLPEWRPGVDYRRSVSARSELGGGVLLELSHEIDYVRWLVGEVSEVTARVGHVSDLETDVEDVAEIVLQFEEGAIGSIHLDMIQRTQTRTCRVIGSEGTLTWDGMTHQVSWYSSATRSWTDLRRAGTMGPNEMYLAELRHFLDCVGGRATPAVTGEDARRVLQIALAAKRSSIERRSVTV